MRFIQGLEITNVLLTLVDKLNFLQSGYTGSLLLFQKMIAFRKTI